MPQSNKKITKLVITLALLLVNAGLAQAFAQGGSIKGKVVADVPDQRRILTGVVVTLSGERLGERKLQSVTDLEGLFDFQGLIAGDYVIAVEFSGFNKYEQRLSVQIDATVEQNILLQPVPLTETVTVTDDRTDARRTESTTPAVAALRFVIGERMTNQSLRERFLVPESKTAIISQIISATQDANLIKTDEQAGGSRKFARYVPFWA